MDLEIRHLRVFLTIARERSISRAARQLHLAQPAVSRTLRQLERWLHAELMTRSSEGIQLTSVGEVFYGKATAAVEAFDVAVGTPPQQPRPLRVGHAWAAFSHYTTRVLRTWRAAYPQVPLELRRIDDPFAGLTSRRTDAAVLRDRLPPGPDFEAQALYEEPRVVVLPPDDPLVSWEQLRLADVTARCVALNIVSGTTRLDLWPTGQRPGSTIEVSNVDDWYSAIAAGDAIGITPASTAEIYPHPDVRYVPLVDAPPVWIYLAWPAASAHPAIATLLSIIHSIIQPERGT
jgi:DNA-binding transcriptional LysR family regulator